MDGLQLKEDISIADEKVEKKAGWRESMRKQTLLLANENREDELVDTVNHNNLDALLEPCSTLAETKLEKGWSLSLVSTLILSLTQEAGTKIIRCNVEC